MCDNTCRLCRRLILSQAITFAGTTLTINIPEGVYGNCEKYCLVLAQAIPDATTVTAEVVITIGDGTTAYPLVDCVGNAVTAGLLRTRTRYATRVATTPTGGSFRLATRICNGNNLEAITG